MTYPKAKFLQKLPPTFLRMILTSWQYAQYAVNFIVHEQTTLKHDSIYDVAAFNDWDSLSKIDHLMQPDGDGKRTIVLTMDEGKGPSNGTAFKVKLPVIE